MHLYAKILRQYYKEIDNSNLNFIYSLFSNNIEYKRGKEVLINGMKALKKFYGENRKIKSGKHKNLQFKIHLNQVVVTGY